MVKIYTSRITYRGLDRLDITRAGADRGIYLAGVFAPSRKILNPMLHKRRNGGITQTDWEKYVTDYTREMECSQQQNKYSWDFVLRLHSATLVCYCTNAAQCHRTVLAGILAKLGAENCGER